MNDLPCNQGGVAACAVVDDDGDLDSFFDRLSHEGGCFGYHVRLHHAFNPLVKGMGLHVGVLVPHADGGDKPDDAFLGMDKDITRLCELFQEARQPRPVGKDLADLITFF